MVALIMNIPDPPLAARLPSLLLELIGIEKTYAAPEGGAEIKILRDLDLQLATGEALAIVGPSGSGKSTLLNIIGALDLPTRGTIHLEGRDLSSLHEDELAAVRRSHVGFVFQQHHLLPQCTVLENVLVPTLALPPARRAANALPARAERLLARMGLQKRLNHRPGQLSGGECQRVAVARALINRPTLLLADEPTGSLDSVAAANLGQLLLELNREEGVALILVTHAPDLARRLPRVLELRDGRLEPA